MITLWDNDVSVLEARHLPNFDNYALCSGRYVLLLHPISDPKDTLAKLSSEEREDWYDAVFLEREEAEQRKLSGYQQSVLAMSTTLTRLSGSGNEDSDWSQHDETVYGDEDAPSWSF
jgi:hypothetical protein